MPWKGKQTALYTLLLCLQVFNLFNLIIERLGDDVRPYGPGILQLLPAVWQQAEGQSLLRIQVRTTSVYLVLLRRACLFTSAHLRSLDSYREPDDAVVQ